MFLSGHVFLIPIFRDFQERNDIYGCYTCKNVSKVYENGSRKTYALQNVSFEIRKGKFVVVLGQSGAGKVRFSISWAGSIH